LTVNSFKTSGRGGRILFATARSFLGVICDFIYPPYCLLCESYLNPNEQIICRQCWQHLPELDRPLISADMLFRHNQSTLYIDQSFAIYEYDLQIRELIHQMKYRGKQKLAKLFGDRLAEKWLRIEPENVACLIPVPLHRRRYKERGYNQSLLLAEAFSRRTGIPVDRNVLIRSRYTQPQAKMTREERLQNVLNAFSVRRSKDIQNIVLGLVDDVVTTGSTVNECARVLRQAGAKFVISISVARA